MTRETNSPYDEESLHLLCSAMLSLQNERECLDFLADLMTIREVQDISQRLLVAKLLREGKPYAQIMARTSVSSATISRVNRCFAYGQGGYRTALARVLGEPEAAKEEKP